MSNSESFYSQKTKVREIIFSAHLAGDLDMDSIIARLEISRRQFFRLKKKFITEKHLSHGLCGKRSNRAINEVTKAKIIDLCKTDYLGWNYEHASETLKWLNDIDISPNTLRKWLLELGITKRKHKQPKKYQRRIPKEHFNEMLQLDGTFGYFLGDGVEYCLMHLVDDATKTSLACLYKAECTISALDILYKWCCKYGIPKSIYSDRHSTYKVNESHKLTIEEELAGREIGLTGFGGVCERLNIKQIYAYSPQAKGRVERKHQLYKDRAIKELKLFGFTILDTANSFLLKDGGFEERINNKFTIEPQNKNDISVAHMDDKQLVQFFTLNNTRVVRNDYTVQLNNVVYQLSRKSVINARSKVVIKENAIDKSITIWADKTQLDYKVIDNYVRQPQDKCITKELQKHTIKKYEQPKDHPFRQYRQKRVSKSQSSSKQLEFLGRIYG
jgi:transposase